MNDKIDIDAYITEHAERRGDNLDCEYDQARLRLERDAVRASGGWGLTDDLGDAERYHVTALLLKDGDVVLDDNGGDTVVVENSEPYYNAAQIAALQDLADTLRATGNDDYNDVADWIDDRVAEAKEYLKDWVAEHDDEEGEE